MSYTPDGREHYGMDMCDNCYKELYMRRAGVRACGRAGVRACGRAGVRACGRAGVRACGRAGVGACGRAGVRTCGRAGVRTCGRVGIHIHTQTHTPAHTRARTHTDIQIDRAPILATGSGYHLVISKVAGCDEDLVSAKLKQHISQVRLASSIGAELTYVLPRDKVHMFPAVFNTLDAERDNLRILNYGLTATTMNEVFLMCVHMSHHMHVRESMHTLVHKSAHTCI